MTTPDTTAKLNTSTTFTAAQRQQVVDYAAQQIGKPYVFGTNGPTSFDCSGLVQAAWAKVGVQLPHNSTQQSDYHTNPYVRTVPCGPRYWGNLLPGDIAFYYPGVTHCALFEKFDPQTGYFWVIQATDEQLGVQRIRMYQYATPVSLGLMGH